MTDREDQDERDLLAAEYALGVLDSGEYAIAKARYAQDAEFAAAVHRWQHRFSPLYREIEEEDVPSALWVRVTGGTRLQVARLVRRVAAWRVGAVAATALAATLATVLVLQPAKVAPPQVVTRVEIPPPEPATFAQLVQADGKARVVARFEPATARLRVKASDLPAKGGAPELWVIADGGAPKSLGLIDRAHEASLTIADDVRPLLHAGATLAVTLEDAATAPHAAPTGAILASGTIARL